MPNWPHSSSNAAHDACIDVGVAWEAALMNITTTLLFYLLFGCAVAVAVSLSSSDASRGQRWFRTLTAVIFWPLYLPTLLQRPASRAGQSAETEEFNEMSREAVVGEDEMSAAIHQVETELNLALTSLGGWSDDVLTREEHRFEELRAAWRSQAVKIRELDRVLSQLVATERAIGPLAKEPSERVRNSERARQANISRLRALRDRYHADLMEMLTRVRELVTMIHLAKYTGAPASRAEELVMQIATSIEGLSEVAAWREAEYSPDAVPSAVS
jgi:hypothetical protein